MKKFLLLLFVVCLTSGMYAQTKKISRVEVYYDDDASPRCIYDFHYDEYGRMLGSDWKWFLGGMAGRTGSIHVTYNDIDNTIKIEDFEEKRDMEWTVAYVEDGRIIKLDTKFNGEDMSTADFTYNNDNELVFNDDIEWLNGNIISIKGEEGVSDGAEFTLSSHDRPDSFPFFIEFIDGISDYDLPTPIYYLPDFFGKRPKKLISGYSLTYYEGSGLENRTYSYKFDSEGNVIEINSDSEGYWVYAKHERIVCSYTTVSGINDVSISKHDNHKAIYNAAGQLRPYVGKGLNIVKTEDGMVRKVVVK